MYNKYTLDNGLRIVTEQISHVKSISIGVWIETGSKNENVINSGISHFIEHMLFKGTSTKTAKDIADLIDGVGGQINAFTSKECTCYYVKVLDSHFDLAIELLADMLFNSKFDPQEIDKERSVILEEISMYEDSPEDLVHDLLSHTIFKEHSLGYPILGTKESLEGIDRQVLIDYMKHHYIPQRAVISVAGNYDEAQLMGAIEKFFGDWKGQSLSQEQDHELQFNFEFSERVKDIEQTHICLGFRGVALGNQSTYPLLVINNILGGSMSSRLFQRIREDKGLAYSIYSYPSAYKGGGLLTIYGGMNPNQLEEAAYLIREEIELLLRDGLTETELQKSKEQLKGNYILGLESTSSRMSSIGKSELLLGKTHTQKEIIQMIDNITMEEINNVIRSVLNLDSLAGAVVSNQKQKNIMEAIFSKRS
ncbi:M16 family metallopeptidase [Alkaliphilus crotonatoxidans]